MKKFDIKAASHKANRFSQFELQAFWGPEDLVIDPAKAAENIAAKYGVKIPASVEEVLEHIVLAQIGSDGGKGESRFYGINKVANRAYTRGYSDKDAHILSAILGIETLGAFSQVQWYIHTDWEPSWFNPEWADEPFEELQSILYFEWEGYQISFHSFTTAWYMLKNAYLCEDREWDQGSSPYTVLQMVKALNKAGFGEWGGARVAYRLQMMEDYAVVSKDDRFEEYLWYLSDNLGHREWGDGDYGYEVLCMWDAWEQEAAEDREAS